MAKLPHLAKALAPLHQRDEGHVQYVGRLVRAKGKIHTAKRGFGAADLTAHDAAALLVGINADVTNAARGDVAATYLELRLAPEFTRKGSKLPERLEPLESIDSLHEALAFLIDAAEDVHRLNTAVATRVAEEEYDPEDLFWIDPASAPEIQIFVSFHAPEPIARVMVSPCSEPGQQPWAFYFITQERQSEINSGLARGAGKKQLYSQVQGIGLPMLLETHRLLYETSSTAIS